MNLLSWTSRFVRPTEPPRRGNDYDNVTNELDRARRFDRPLSLIVFDIQNARSAAALRVYAQSNNNSASRGGGDHLFSRRIDTDPKIDDHTLASEDSAARTLIDSKRAHDIVFELTKPRPLLVFVCPETTKYDAHLAAKRLNSLVHDNDGRYGIASFPRDGVSISLLIERAADNIKSTEEHTAQRAFHAVG